MKYATELKEQSARILIIDDQEIVSEGLRMLLDHQAGLSVVATASNCKDAVAAAKQLQPDVTLLDINLGDDYGLDCLDDLLAVSPMTKVLVLTGERDFDTHYTAVVKGAVGLVKKIESHETLVQAVRKVRAGEVWFDGKLMARIVDEFRRALNGQAVAPADAPTSAASPHPQPAVSNTVARNAEEQTKIERLTNREQEVIKLIGLGLRNQQIADRLFISVITVRHHLSSVFSKLEVGDRFELAIYAYRNGLAQPPI